MTQTQSKSEKPTKVKEKEQSNGCSLVFVNIKEHGCKGICHKQMYMACVVELKT